MKFSILIAIVTILVTSFASSAADASRKIHFYSDIKIKSWDGTIIMAQAAVPERKGNETFATILCPNSWMMPVIEYIVQLFKMSELEIPFVVMEYETRGWWGETGGEIDVFGPKDQKDIHSLLDYLDAQASTWGVNTSAHSMLGISYGALGSLLGAALDPRVKVAVPMSGLGSLFNSLMPNKSPCSNTVNLLVVTAQILGKASPQLLAMAQEILHMDDDRNVTALMDFAQARSPVTWMNTLRTKPIFWSQNLNDEFFPPDEQLDVFRQLCPQPSACRSRFLFNHGGHAEAELTGLVGLPNYPFEQALKFLQYHLQGIPNDIMATPLLQVEVGNLLSNQYVGYSNFPPADHAAMQPISFGFVQRGSDPFGMLMGEWPSSSKKSGRIQEPPRLIMRSLLRGVDSITYSENGGLYPPGLIEDYLEPVGIPLDQELAFVPREHNIIFKTASTIPHDMLICGHPTVNLTINPSQQKWQVYSYLYEVDGLDLGRQLSWGVMTNFGGRNTTSSTKFENWNLRFMCERIAAGRKIALGFSLYNELYEPASKTVAVSFDYAGASFTLPLNPS